MVSGNVSEVIMWWIFCGILAIIIIAIVEMKELTVLKVIGGILLGPVTLVIALFWLFLRQHNE